MIDVAITIVNYKMANDIRQLLESLKKDLHGSNLKVQIIIADNTPDQEMASLIKEHQEIKYLPMPKNVGFGAANNAAFKACDAKYYFILNPDTMFLENDLAIESMYNFMESHPKIGMIGPKLLNNDGTLQYSCYRFPSFWIPLFRRSSLGEKPRFKKQVDDFFISDYDHETDRPVDWIMGSAMFARGKNLKEVGMFDDRFFMYFEDCDLCRRFWEAHYPVYYVPEIKIMHRHGRGSAQVTGFIRSIIKNRLTRIHIISWLKYMWKWRNLKT